MLSFLEFYNLFESVNLQTFKPSQLGLSNSIEDLPDKAPYGLWIDRHGNFIATKPGMSHDDIARIIFNNAKIELTPQDSRNDILLKNGFIRVVFTPYKELLYGTFRKEDVSQSQLKLLKYLKGLYGIEIMLFVKEFE